MRSGTSALEYFTSWNKDVVRAEINTICSAHTLSMDVDTNKKVQYCGCEVSSSGQLVIIFAEKMLATNVQDALSEPELNKALNDAPTDNAPMSFLARIGIKRQYDPEIGNVQAKIKSLLQQDITLDPNFDDSFAKLKAASDKHSGWEKSLGGLTLQYFQALAWRLEEREFESDDMLREAVVEAIESRTFKFRIVDEGQMKQSYNEVQIVDGVLHLQVKSTYSYLRTCRLWQEILICCRHLPSTLRRTLRTSATI